MSLGISLSFDSLVLAKSAVGNESRRESFNGRFGI